MKKDKNDNYLIERFSIEELTKLQHSITMSAAAIDGLPKNHVEVFDKRGWLLPFLFGYDDLLWGRWEYWLTILTKNTIEGSGPIPKISWADRHSSRSQATMQMLQRCLNHHEAGIDSFADWMLWGLAGSNEPLKISGSLNSHYYKTFDLFLVLDNPTDYLSELLSEQTGKGYKSGLGYFPTPFPITQMMVEMTKPDIPPDELKRLTVHDPCIGCGAMLLHASNYFLRGYGQDISNIAIRLCLIQFYWYAPWYARPGQVSGFEETEVLQLIPAITHKNITADQLAFSF